MPKEHFELIAEIGALTVKDFVEVTQYSLEELGTEGMKAVRRVSWRALKRLRQLEDSDKTDTADRIPASEIF